MADGVLNFDDVPLAADAPLSFDDVPEATAGALSFDGVPEAAPESALTFDDVPEAEGATIGGTLADVGTGVLEAPKQILGGMRDAWQEAAEALESAATWAGEATGIRPLSGFAGAAEAPLPEVDRPESTTGGLVRGVAQFVAGFAPAAKALQIGKAATVAGQFARASVAGAIADATVFDPHEERLSNLVEEYPALQNPVTAYLAADPSDGEAEGRFKNAVEGLGLGTMAEGLFQGVRAVRAGLRAKEAPPAGAAPASDPAAVTDAPDTPAAATPDAPATAQAAPEAPTPRMAPLTPEDIESVLPNDAISRGRAIIEDAVEGRPLDIARQAPEAPTPAATAREIADPNARPVAVDRPLAVNDRVRINDLGGAMDGAEGFVVEVGRNGATVEAENGMRFTVGSNLLERVDSQRPPGAAIETPQPAGQPVAERAAAAPTAPVSADQASPTAAVKIDADLGATPSAVEPIGSQLAPNPPAEVIDAPRVQAGEAAPAQALGRDVDQIAEPAPARDPAPGGSPDPDYGPRAGNIDFDQLQSVEDIRAVLKVAADRNDDFMPARRGVVSDDTLSALADDLRMTPEQLQRRRVGQALNAEELLAARRVLANSAESLVGLARAAQEGGDEALGAFHQAFTRHVAIQETVSGAEAEAGRALRQFQLVAQSDRQRARLLKEMIDRAGGRGRVEDFAEKIATLNDPAAVNKLTRDMYRGGIFRRGRDMLHELWINSILSGPTTHVVNLTSNALTNLWTLPEEALGAAFGAVRGGNERIFMREPAARAFGLVEGARDAFAAAARTLVTGNSFDSAFGKLDVGHGEAIPGLAGKIVRAPTRMLEVSDSFFKALAMRQELNALAVRKAAREGLRGDAFARRVAEIKLQPTADMMDQAIERARELTFTSPLGEWGQAINGLRRIPGMSWFLPFVKTPANILKFASRRSAFAPLVKEWRADIMAGGVRRDRALAQLTIGSTAAIVAFSYAREGVISGGGPSDPRERQALMSTGWQPYSIKIGGKWYAFDRLDPLGLLIGVAADMAEVVDKAGEEEASELAAGLGLAFAKTLLDKSYLQGVSDLVNVLQDPDRYAGRWVRNFAGSFVPNIVGQYTRADDPVLREVRTMADNIKARLPGESASMFPRRDVWGEPIVRAGGVFGDGVAGRLLSPSRVSEADRDPVTSELLRLGITPTKPGRSLRGVELTGGQYDMLQEISGRTTKRVIAAFQESEGYAALSDPMRREVTSRIMERVRSKVRNGFLAANPEIGALGKREKVEATIEGRARERVKQE